MPKKRQDTQRKEDHSLPLWQRLVTAPLPNDRRRAEAFFQDLLLKEPEAAPEWNAVMHDKNVHALIAALADQSPFLWHLIRADPLRLLRLLCHPPEQSLASTLQQLTETAAKTEAPTDLMLPLRRARQEIALLVALADLGGVWDFASIIDALSRSADAFIGQALDVLLRQEIIKGHFKNLDRDKPAQNCGLAIIALGKLGAHELNYSSDVDLMVIYDPAVVTLDSKQEAGPLFVRITKQFVRLLQETTPDGFVLRVDLRLRPDPGSTAIAMSAPAALDYYQILGQNWERAAMIKARYVAGDRERAETFLAALAPFIWRKYFDYAAIADIHAMKRQIHAFRGHAEITVKGHDIKLGRGGIREIEFFVQTQQLIFGGKRPRLRGSTTLAMLGELSAEGWITKEATEDLTRAYIFLRTIEHRLQMVADEQTQRLPAETKALRQFARFCGASSEKSFTDEMMHHLHLVSFHYARLFEQAPSLDTAMGSLVFTGVNDDPETLETLRQLGYAKPEQVTEMVRGWHFGHHAAIRGTRAREVLTELVPQLLQAFAHSGDPDAAVALFDQALARMPAAVELFSILKSNPRLCELFGDILGGAPRFAHVVIAYPHLLDAMIDGRMLHSELSEEAFDTRAHTFLEKAKNTEDFLDAARDFAREENFLIGLRLLSGLIEPPQAGTAFSALARTLIKACLAHVEKAFAKEHGKIAKGCIVVVALGKLGSGEMTASSDLDLIVIYDFDAETPQSDGRHPLHALQYYTRLAQRLISALTVATRRGRLYDVDLRLRPSGRKGPIATQFESFVDYQYNDAESWEHMALVRQRIVAGDAGLAARTQAAIERILRLPRDKSLNGDVLAMRRLVAREKGETDPADPKHIAGGLMDIEFLAQYFVLRHAREWPDLIAGTTAAILEQSCRHALLRVEDCANLLHAYWLETNVMQMARLILDPEIDASRANAAVKRRLAQTADLPDYAMLERALKESRTRVRKLFLTLLEHEAG
ncbi:bifunctional [glutamine synthetase] adenylyltransferase/[glutamine synthetase]-adenylyl-L-tyrosine phosphorylase [Beijerinckia indica]|uniref:Bifunctional glutamine synthetase adenylyltransferase/adenylyl-removing enzyme n=1 Tax=Beijerinckia indica subsp. indica (strain ATCC 9039 / DSM 1715 / NCIMB 8712) TaxID=395963 RepID=B2IGU7_BEII9|nr:bifunctional [glutamine synthetase] adenylyltransferase/[glutamine synthetase]-adenylyl-L-tyrosine phosphorylase [Beijerinckia indica]ACB95856.1 (Glutamate--ammonia-ligase) adenylyltransferase [Beijerinckia indica subsp. indica ATCC 9039]